MQALQWLTLSWSDDADGIGTLEAMASTEATHAAAVDAEVAALLDWARTHFPQGPGPVDEGHDWDQDLQTVIEDEAQGEGNRAWRTVTLTLSGTPAFLAAVAEAFQEAG